MGQDEQDGAIDEYMFHSSPRPDNSTSSGAISAPQKRVTSFESETPSKRIKAFDAGVRNYLDEIVQNTDFHVPNGEAHVSRTEVQHTKQEPIVVQTKGALFFMSMDDDANATATTPHGIDGLEWEFDPSDEIEFRKMAQTLRSRMPEKFSMRCFESLVSFLKRRFIKYSNGMRRSDAFRLVYHIVSVEALQQQVRFEDGHDEPEVYAQHTPTAAPFRASSSYLLSSCDDDPSIERFEVDKREPELCKEQQELVDIILRGRNVFYTGSAGCGKSTVLRYVVKRLEDTGRRVRIVAPTGRAALDVGGTTTWTFAGWTPNDFKKPIELLEADAHGKRVWKRLFSVDVLVIDEISMVENFHLERLNRIMKSARGRPDLAFGGVQLIITGDFCQLPPVKPFQFCMDCGRELNPVKPGLVYECSEHGKFYDKDKWAFCSTAWGEARLEHVQLNTIHRQSDETLIKILQKLRVGYPLTSEDRNNLLNHPSDTKDAVRLFSTHNEVRRINDAEFARLQTKQLDFECLDNFIWNEQHLELRNHDKRQPDGTLAVLRDHRLDPVVRLKKGMLVVLLVNLDIASGLVNGSQGKVIGFQRASDYYRPKAKSTLRREADDSDKENELLNSPAGVPELGGKYAKLREDEVQKFIKKAQVQEWPVVEFSNNVKRTIFAECIVNALGDEKPYSLLMRTQIPLVAAWAMTIHRSQGMTLNKVVVDLARSFESGQAYVALSRARSLEGLKVESLGLESSSSDDTVREFLKEKFGI